MQLADYSRLNRCHQHNQHRKMEETQHHLKTNVILCRRTCLHLAETSQDLQMIASWQLILRLCDVRGIGVVGTGRAVEVLNRGGISGTS